MLCRNVKRLEWRVAIFGPEGPDAEILLNRGGGGGFFLKGLVIGKNLTLQKRWALTSI